VLHVSICSPDLDPSSPRPRPHRGTGRSRRRATILLASAITVGALAAVVPWAAAGAAPAPQQVVGLAQGASGTGVRELQEALLRAGIPVPGGADGVFGPATRQALVSFQQSKGIAPSGAVDAATAAALGLATPAPAAGTSNGASNGAGGLVGLSLGASGEGVRRIQQALNDVGVYVPGGIDGQFGTGTRTAISNFQRWNGLTVTGTVTQAVVKALGLTGTSTPAPATPAKQGVASAPTVASASGYVGLARGARGDLVAALQKALLARGVPVPGGADGVFGPATDTALRQFQRANGASATGVVSAQDASLLGLSAVAERSPASAPAAGSNPYVGLALGATGSKVKTLQQALIASGVSVRGGADGAFGPATKTALVTYQRWNGLSPSGTVDADTASRLGLGAAAPAPGNSGYAGLAVGSRGAKVKELQQALIATGLTVRGGADGVFGPATKAALIAFQSVNGIEQTGVLTATGAQILGLGTAAGPSGIVTVKGYPSYGEQSSRVAALQKALMNAGIAVPGGADGMFGSSTAGAVIAFQRRAGLSVTGKVDDRTAAKLGLGAAAAPAPVSSAGIAFDVFPVQGRCYFGDTFQAPRGGGRTHLGVDIIANEGNLLYAVVDGVISKQYWDQPGSRSGNGLRLQQPNGTYFTYLHLLDVAPGIKVGVKVRAGDVIGYVGATGNAATPHLHLEVHPNGGAAVNPYPIAKAADACKVTAPRS
jgi:peptidoglycan hydrolase-like protein with peptidoglycan-binding domain